jgi:phosphate-selective porin OprO/OprP
MNYGVGLFNGDGMDDATGGDVDEPEVTGRLVFAPFKKSGLSWLKDFQIGGSLSYARIDRNNVNINIKTTGLTTFFDVATSAKYNVIREADKRYRYGAELGWAFGPFALASEYIKVQYRDITTSASQFNVDLEDTYAWLLWMVTGERPEFKNSVFQPIKPERSIWEGGWGGLGIAFRYDVFAADDAVYETLINEGDSVRKAEAYSLAVNWFLDANIRLILDATRTYFDKPLKIDRDSITGESIYSDREDVLTARFQFEF